MIRARERPRAQSEVRLVEIDVDGVLLKPVFQRYTSVSHPDIVQGELLSRPTGSEPPEIVFANLGLEDQFRVLEWQLQLQQLLHDELGAHVSINVHNRVVAEEESRRRFLDLVARASAPATFEFTETYPMPPFVTSNSVLNALRKLGHTSALDDFGSGLNGMSLLTDYDFDVIKIDRCLILDLGHRPEKRKTLRLMLEMLEVLGKEHVVEGVETQETFEILRELGYETFQGYLFGRPVAVSELLAGGATVERA
jgi:EAL domain-containing protein (putative c-di-GMP-specific phosphodiesterase class I)